MRRATLAALAVVLVPSSALAQSAAPPKPIVEVTSLRLLREKGVITRAEYDAAMRDLADSVGARAAEASSLVVGKWSTTVYGFVEEDNVYDSTQSFQDFAGNAAVQRPGPAPLATGGTHYAADHGRMTMSIRNSRLGFRMRAPETNGVRVSGQLELDLLGNQPQATAPTGSTSSEGSFFTNAAPRIRHANFRVETPIVDVLVGQTWDLFGWQSVYHPNTVEIQGVPGELYSRTPQVRVSKTLKTDAITFEVAAAAVRPPTRDSEVPEAQGGFRFAVNHWTGMTTNGATATSIMPMSIALTGDYRHFGVPEFAARPAKEVGKDTSAIAVDAFFPVVPATPERKGNSLSLTGELASGYGIADLYTGLTGGIVNPTLATPAGAAAAPAYPQDFDNGLVVFDANGGLHGIQWTTYLVGVQYYLPGLDGRVWLSGNYAHVQSANSSSFTQTAAPIAANVNYVNAAGVRESEDWFDVNVFGDVGSGVRIGAEYANFNDRYADGVHAINHRVQLSGFFLF